MFFREAKTHDYFRGLSASVVSHGLR